MLVPPGLGNCLEAAQRRAADDISLVNLKTVIPHDSYESEAPCCRLSPLHVSCIVSTEDVTPSIM